MYIYIITYHNCATWTTLCEYLVVWDVMYVVRAVHWGLVEQGLSCGSLGSSCSQIIARTHRNNSWKQTKPLLHTPSSLLTFNKKVFLYTTINIIFLVLMTKISCEKFHHILIYIPFHILKILWTIFAILKREQLVSLRQNWFCFNQHRKQ